MRNFAAMAAGYHIGFRSELDDLLALDEHGRRAFAQAMWQVGRDQGLYVFGLADRHGHAGLAGPKVQVGRFLHDASLALRRRLGVKVVARVIKEVADSWHAERLVAYIHEQDVGHGLECDPRREGTSLPDCFGLRPEGAWLAARVRQFAPRVTRADLLQSWGLGSLDEAVEPPPLSELADLGAAALARSHLEGREPVVVAMRRACVALVPDAPAAAVAQALSVDERSVRRWRRAGAAPALVRALRLWLSVRAQRPAVPDARLFG